MENTILAKDTEINKTYLSALVKYKVTVIRKDENFVYVLQSEKNTEREIPISLETELIECEKSEPKEKEIKKESVNKKESVTEDNNSSKQPLKEGEKKMAQNKNPRSVVIDQALLAYKKGDEVDFNKIADKVIAAGNATEKERKNVISQARVRNKWYTVDGKINPQSPEGKKAKENKKTTGKAAGAAKKSTSKKSTGKGKSKK